MMARRFVFLLLLCLLLSIPVSSAASAYRLQDAAYQDSAYQNPDASATYRAADLLAQMTLDEKIAQMALVEVNSIDPDDLTVLGIGGVLSGGGGYPRGNNTTEGWADRLDALQEKVLASRLAIPIIYGVDAVHGHNNLRGATIFPHNIGMGATRDPALMEQVCRTTALEMVATGIYWNYAPVVAVAQDARWGRYYESFGENTDLVSQMATACIHGLQGDSLADPLSVLATPKHFVGDGGTAWGSSTTEDYMIDQGVTEVDEATLRAVHLPPYQAAIEAGAQSIMISFSSWGGMKMHAQHYLITDVLKGELGFSGFVVSDWGGIGQLLGNPYQQVVTGINAGIDMVMIPSNYHLFIDTLKQAVDAGDVSQERIDDAVRRILTVKFEMGLFEHPLADRSLIDSVGSDEHRALARQAVAESQVLLKNDGDLLPLSPQVGSIFVAGRGADDIGMQSGGWTIEWQGIGGNLTPGTTLLQGIQAAVSENTQVTYDRAGSFEGRADVGIVVVGETPYAEGRGDNGRLTLSRTDWAAIYNVREQVDKLVVIVLSGRPLILTDGIADFDALVASWLPGTEGEGVADVLFGVQPFTGKLPVTWIASVDQLPLSHLLETGGQPLFPFGYGLTTGS